MRHNIARTRNLRLFRAIQPGQKEALLNDLRAVMGILTLSLPVIGETAIEGREATLAEDQDTAQATRTHRVKAPVSGSVRVAGSVPGIVSTIGREIGQTPRASTGGRAQDVITPRRPHQGAWATRGRLLPALPRTVPSSPSPFKSAALHCRGRRAVRDARELRLPLGR